MDTLQDDYIPQHSLENCDRERVRFISEDRLLRGPDPDYTPRHAAPEDAS